MAAVAVIAPGKAPLTGGVGARSSAVPCAINGDGENSAFDGTSVGAPADPRVVTREATVMALLPFAGFAHPPLTNQVVPNFRE